MPIIRNTVTLIASLAFAGLTSIASAAASNLPQLGDSSAIALSPIQEQKLGRKFMAMLRQQLPIMHDPLVEEYIQSLGLRLVAAANRPRQHFEYFVVADPDINAFAGPGGYIAVNTGLIERTRNESELAAVMAHETAHVLQRHIARGIEQQKAMTLPSIAALIAAIALGSQSGNAGMAAATAGMGMATNHLINFTRSEEQEADNIGMRILNAARFDPHAMAGFFGQMQKYSLDYEQSPYESLLFRTHPSTPTRIANAEAMASRLPKRKVINSNDYYLIKARIFVLLSSNMHKVIQQLSTHLKSKNPHARNAAAYGTAMAELKLGKYKTALNRIKKLSKQNPNEIFFTILEAKILNANHQGKAALKLLKDHHELYPDFNPLTIAYISKLLSDQNYKQATKLINHLINQQPNKARNYALLAKAQNEAGQKLLATVSQAQAALLYDQNYRALNILQNTLKQKMGADQRLIIKAKIQQAEDKIKEMEENR